MYQWDSHAKLTWIRGANSETPLAYGATLSFITMRCPDQTLLSAKFGPKFLKP